MRRTNCRQCGAPIAQPGRGRPREFCRAPARCKSRHDASTRIRVGAVSLPLWVRLMAQDAATRGDQTAAQRWTELVEAIAQRAQRTVDSREA